MKIKRYSINDVQQNRFYQIPKFLFEGEFKKLSAEAKLLYALLKDRHELSIQNRWINEDGEVFFYFTRSEMADMLGCGRDKIIKICAELKSFGLFEEVRQGLGKPNIIYLNYFDYSESKSDIKSNHYENTQEKDVKNSEKPFNNAEVGKSDFKRSENPTSRNRENRLQELVKSDPNDTDINKTNNIIYNLSYPIKDNIIYNTNNGEKDKIDTEEMPEEVKEELDLKYYDNPDEETKNFLSCCYELISEIFHSKKEKVLIAGQPMQLIRVKERLRKLNKECFLYVKECFDKTTSHIHNIKSYLLTSLFNAPVTIDAYYRQLYHHHFPQKDDTESSFFIGDFRDKVNNFD